MRHVHSMGLGKEAPQETHTSVWPRWTEELCGGLEGLKGEVTWTRKALLSLGSTQVSLHRVWSCTQRSTTVALWSCLLGSTRATPGALEQHH